MKMQRDSSFIYIDFRPPHAYLFLKNKFSAYSAKSAGKGFEQFYINKS